MKVSGIKLSAEGIIGDRLPDSIRKNIGASPWQQVEMPESQMPYEQRLARWEQTERFRQEHPGLLSDFCRWLDPRPEPRAGELVEGVEVSFSEPDAAPLPPADHTSDERA